MLQRLKGKTLIPALATLALFGGLCRIAPPLPENLFVVSPLTPEGQFTAGIEGPAMTIGWSNGGMMVSPRAAASDSARLCRSIDVVPAKITSAP